MDDEPAIVRGGPRGPNQPGFLSGGGELGELIRGFDWAATPLGPPETWPQNLRMALRIMLTSRQPIWIGWGEELTYFYNDPYKSIIGGKHPWALGRPTTEVWREIWNEIGPMLDTAMTGDQGTYVEAQLLIMERNGYPEETYYTFSYSPIPNDDGSVGGIICANSDDTQQVIGERQLALLRDLAADTTHARTWQEACEQSADAFRTDARDIPFAIIYMAESDGSSVKLAAVCGIERGHPAAPEAIQLDQPSFWPVGEVLRSAEPADRCKFEIRSRRRYPDGSLDGASLAGGGLSDLARRRDRPRRRSCGRSQSVSPVRRQLPQLHWPGGRTDLRRDRQCAGL